MNGNLTGSFARSLAGHDKNGLYIITDADEKYVYLCDGKLKKSDRPKKKKLKHVQLINYKDSCIYTKLQNDVALTDEEIRFAIKKYNSRN